MSMSRRQPGVNCPRPVRRALSLLAGALAVAWLLGEGGFVQAEQTGAPNRHPVDPALEAYLPTVGLKGKLVVVGSDTMQPLLSKFHKGFSQWYPDVTVSVETEGSSAGFEQFLEWSGTAHGNDRPMLLAYSHPLEPEELKEFIAKTGYAPLEIQVGLGAVCVYVHESNPLRELTLEQVDAMFGATRKRGASSDITRWGQLGLRGEWERKPIHLYGRDKQSGTRHLFMLRALLNGEFKASVQEKSGASPLILAISDDPLGVGYAGIVFMQLTTVKIVALAEKGGKPYVRPTADAVRQGIYPMSRKLFLYANKAPSEELPQVVREFLKFANSQDGQEMVAQSRFYPLSMSEVSRNLAMLAARPKSK